MKLAAGVVAALLVCACEVSVPEGKLRCGPGLGCPSGLTCVDLGRGPRCHSQTALSGGTRGDASSTMRHDAGSPDAAGAGGDGGGGSGFAGSGANMDASVVAPGASGSGGSSGTDGDAASASGGGGSSGTSADSGASGGGGSSGTSADSGASGGGGSSGTGGDSGASGGGGSSGTGGDAGDSGTGGSGGTGGSAPTGPTVDVCGTQVEITKYLTRGQEYVVDLATIALNPERNPLGASAVQTSFSGVRGAWSWIVFPAGCTGTQCYDRNAYQQLVFGDSQVAVSALHGLSFQVGGDGTGVLNLAVLSNEDVLDVRNALGKTRVLFVPTVMPNDRIAAQLLLMDHWASEAAAYQMYTAWAPQGGSGFTLNDTVARQVIEKGIAIGRPIFLIRKGMPAPGYAASLTDPRDVGPAAVRHPGAKLLIVQAGFEFGMSSGMSSRPDGTDHGWGTSAGRWPEGPYDAVDPDVQAKYPLDRGVNALISSLRSSGRPSG